LYLKDFIFIFRAKQNKIRQHFNIQMVLLVPLVEMGLQCRIK
jgi:hypothetical protein